MVRITHPIPAIYRHTRYKVLRSSGVMALPPFCGVLSTIITISYFYGMPLLAVVVFKIQGVGFPTCAYGGGIFNAREVVPFFVYGSVGNLLN